MPSKESIELSRTKVFKAREGSESVKGTIPSEVVAALKLKNNDVIEWELVVDNGQIIAKVRKVVSN